MTVREANAKVFITAFRALAKSEREEILRAMLDDNQLYDDVLDTIIARRRLHEKGRPLEDFEAELRRSGEL